MASLKRDRSTRRPYVNDNVVCCQYYPPREKCPYSEFFWSILSRIRTEYGEIVCISPYSVRMRENTDTLHAVTIISHTIISVVTIQLRFSVYCLISASKNYSTKGLRFHPYTATSIYYSLRLLKITEYQECYLFFTLVKHVCLLTGTFIN